MTQDEQNIPSPTSSISVSWKTDLIGRKKMLMEADLFDRRAAMNGEATSVRTIRYLLSFKRQSGLQQDRMSKQLEAPWSVRYPVSGRGYKI